MHVAFYSEYFWEMVAWYHQNTPKEDGVTVATLKFDLDSNEDKKDFSLVMKATSMALAFTALDEKLRQKVKYEELPPEVLGAYENARNMLHEVVEDEGFRIGELFEC
jgi:hypothetical protein